MVLGVATSSLVVQNALFVYLEKNVKGPDKDDVRSPLPPIFFDMVRKKKDLMNQ